MINQKVKETLTLTSKKIRINGERTVTAGSDQDQVQSLTIREVLLIMISKTIQKKLKSRWVKDFI